VKSKKIVIAGETDLVGAVVLRDLLAENEDALVAFHLFVDGLI